MKKITIVLLSILYAALIIIAHFVMQKHGSPPRWTDTLGRTLAGMIPLLLLFCKRIPFNLPIIFGYYALLFCCFFLGAIVRFYDRFSWWDTILHFFGAGYMGFVAAALYWLFIPKAAEREISGWLIFLFVLAFAALSSSIWEILEYAGSVMGALEPDSNKDTMTDMTAGMAGAIVVAIIAAVRRASRPSAIRKVERKAEAAESNYDA